MAKVFKKRLCRICGKIGFEKKNIKIKLSSGILNTSKINLKCTYCNSTDINDYHLERLKDRNLIKNKKLTKEGLKFLDELEFNRENRVETIREQRDSVKKRYKAKSIFWNLSLIPDGVFGISIYVLIILFCIWIFGDFGGECGVDYAPRFFGEC